MKTWMAATALAIVAFGAQDEGDKKEPPMIFSIEADGKKIAVELDKPFEIDGKKMTLRAEAFRVFDIGDVKFHYPSGMSFEPNLDIPTVRMWNLKGKTAIFMVQRFANHPDHEATRKAVTDSTVAIYKNAKKSDVKLALDKGELPGTRVEFSLGKTKIVQTAYSFKVGADAVVLVLQDTPKPDGEATEEFKAAVKMLQESFTFPKE